MSVQSFLPLPWVAADGYDTLVVSTARRNEPNNIPSARGEIACPVYAGTGLHAHFLPKGCSACCGTGKAGGACGAVRLPSHGDRATNVKRTLRNRALRIALGLVMLGVIAWGLGSHPAIVVAP